MPLVSRTRATLRSAEFGFFGVWVKTRTQTPRFCGLLCRAGLFVLLRTASRPLRTSWLIVGTLFPHQKNRSRHRAHARGDAVSSPALERDARRRKQSPIAELSHVDRSARTTCIAPIARNQPGSGLLLLDAGLDRVS